MDDAVQLSKPAKYRLVGKLAVETPDDSHAAVACASTDSHVTTYIVNDAVQILFVFINENISDADSLDELLERGVGELDGFQCWRLALGKFTLDAK